MSPVYFDSSAWVKLYCQELGSKQVRALFDSGRTVVCSWLGLVEVIAVYARRRKSGLLSDEEFEKVRRKVQSEWGAFWQIQLSERQMDEAARVVSTHALRGADAVHLASLLSIQRSRAPARQQAALITSDHELAAADRSLGLPVFDPATGSIP